MKIIFLTVLLYVCLADPLVTKQLIKELTESAQWEPTPYEENVFKGIEAEEIQDESIEWADIPITKVKPSFNTDVNSINWMEKGASCIHDIKNQGDCSGASFAFSVSGMISDRCCLKGKDYGWLSTMELLTCSKENYGCAGGWPAWAMLYTVNNGLVDEGCYPYSGRNEPCPAKCKNSKDWTASHVCKCTNPVTLPTLIDVKNALADGPVVVTFEAYDDFFAYKSGIYCHQTGSFRKLLSARVVGYSEEEQPHLVLAMSFGTSFGEKGLVRMCTTCCGMFGKYEKGNVACTPTP